MTPSKNLNKAFKDVSLRVGKKGYAALGKGPYVKTCL
jgi:hypothetical protein